MARKVISNIWIQAQIKYSIGVATYMYIVHFTCIAISVTAQGAVKTMRLCFCCANYE